MSLLFFVLFLMLGTGTISKKASCQSGDTTSLFVKLLRFGVDLLELDPLVIPHISLPIPKLGNISLSGGRLVGLGTLRRTGSNVICANDAGLNVQLAMGIGQLAMNCGIGISTAKLSQEVEMSLNLETACIAAKIKETSDALLALQLLKLEADQGISLTIKAQ